jgi:CRP-like cAMP-binding protein
VDGIFLVLTGEFEVSKMNNESEMAQIRVMAKTQRIQRLSLYLVGLNEIFGLEEIVENSPFRSTSVVCTSTHGTCWFISSENFIDCVNQFKFSDKVLQEQIVKHQLYTDRIK